MRIHPYSKLKFRKILILITTTINYNEKVYKFKNNIGRGVLLIDSESVSSNSVNSGNTASGNCIYSGNYTGGSRRYLSGEIFYHLYNLNNEESSIFLLSVLLMTSGLILFIYGLISGQLYQFIMAFFFLVPGLVLDDARQQQLCAR